MARTPKVETWFGSQRGISPQTLDAFGITADDKGNVVYPYSNAVKLRANITRPDLDRKIWWQPPLGSGQIDLFGPDQPSRKTYFLVEGESDTMRLWQELKKNDALDRTGVFGLSGVNTWRAELAEKMRDGATVYVILDNDDAYENPQAVESVEGAWPKILADLGGRRAVRVRLPRGVKDVCEFFDAYDFEAWKVLLKQAPRRASFFTPINFDAPIPERDWLLDEVIHWRSFASIVGPPGLGKSWWTMGMAVALAEGWKQFMGLPVQHHGQILYFDEENPEDIVRSRMAQLGLSEKGWENVHYVSNQGLDIVEQYEAVRMEVATFAPVAVFFDSLAEITSAEENSKTEMKTVMSNLKSLSRDFETTVMFIHHADKEKGESRGSSHIRASTDAEWAIQEAKREDTVRLVCKKHRHGIRRGETHLFSIEDVDEAGKKRTTLRPVLDPALGGTF